MPRSPKLDVQSLLDTHKQPFLVIDRAFKVTAVNQAFARANGMPANELVGRSCFEVSHGNTRPCFELGDACPHHQVFETERTHSCLHVHQTRDGTEHRVRVTAFPLLDSAGKTYVGELIEDLDGDQTVAESGVSMVGTSPSFLAMMEHLLLAARSDAPVLLQGETGTGKELAASFLHQQSPRSQGPFLTLDCTVLSESLFESEVFGHERGAFTGSQGKKLGLFELAAGGTLFLDEIGELSPIMQAKLLRVLETGEFRRVGGTQTLFADVRIVCATNRDLLSEVGAGRFREDLYYRVACLTVALPSLRHRTQDIPLLAHALIERVARARHRDYGFTERALDWLQTQDFPGNVREMRNLLHAALAVSADGRIDLPQLQQVAPRTVSSPNATGIPKHASAPPHADPASEKRPRALSEMEEEHIARLLREYGGNRCRVADALGISVRTLYRKLRKYRLR